VGTPAKADVDRLSTSPSGINVGMVAAATSGMPPAAVAYIGSVSTKALNMKGVAIVTPFPANMRLMEAMTLCLIATACSLSVACALSGNEGHTWRPSSFAILQFCSRADPFEELLSLLVVTADEAPRAALFVEPLVVNS